MNWRLWVLWKKIQFNLYHRFKWIFATQGKIWCRTCDSWCWYWWRESAYYSRSTDKWSRETSSSSYSRSTTNTTLTFMLLYLNDQTFSGSSAYTAKLESVLKARLTSDSIQLILAHEKDVFKGGCDFGDFFSQAPQKNSSIHHITFSKT